MGATPTVNAEESIGEIFPEYRPEDMDLTLRNALRQIIYSPNPEPLQMIMRVVTEELDKLKQNHMPMAEPHTVPQTQAPETPRKKLVFSNPSLQKIYTGNQVLDRYGFQLELCLVDINYRSGGPIIMDHRPLVVELCVLNGDFGPTGTWTSQEFDDNIVKQRSEKPPLLVGNLHVMLNNGKATIEDIKFTDNSSWTRTKTFKIGAKLLATGRNDDHSGVVLEAVTEAFRIYEGRMQSNAKRYPPNLDDEVWRLEKIRKDGAFHKKLKKARIYKVKDILEQFKTSDGVEKLRGILTRMPDKWWSAMLDHAVTSETEGSRHWQKILENIAGHLDVEV